MLIWLIYPFNTYFLRLYSFHKARHSRDVTLLLTSYHSSYLLLSDKPPTHNGAAWNSDSDFAHESTVWAETGEDSASLFHMVSAGVAQRLGLLVGRFAPSLSGRWGWLLAESSPGTVTGMTTHTFPVAAQLPHNMVTGSPKRTGRSCVIFYDSLRSLRESFLPQSLAHTDPKKGKQCHCSVETFHCEISCEIYMDATNFWKIHFSTSR